MSRSESRTKEKSTARAAEQVDEIALKINKQYGDGAVQRLGAASQAPIAVIPSGSLALDRALGTGGYPRGRITEIFGPESSGKTTLTLHAIAQVQAAGGTAAFVDAEHAFDPNYARSLGVDLDRLLVAQPDCGEQGLDIAGALVETGAVDLVVVDSVAALVPKAEIDGEMGDNHVGLHARLMSRGVRKLTADVSRTNTAVLFINQLRQKIGVVFGNPETTTGGNALRFFASVRLDVRRIGKVSVGDNVVGNRTRVKVVKNKCAPPFQEAEFDIRWGQGVDSLTELLDYALEGGAVLKNGSHLVFNGKPLGHGRERAREALASDPALRAALAAAAQRAAAGDASSPPGGPPPGTPPGTPPGGGTDPGRAKALRDSVASSAAA